MYVKFLGRQRKVNALTDNYLRWNTKITRASRDKRNNLDTAWSISNTILRVVFDNGFFLNEIDRLYYVKFDLCTLKLITYYFTCKQDFSFMINSNRCKCFTVLMICCGSLQLNFCSHWARRRNRCWLIQSRAAVSTGAVMFNGKNLFTGSKKKKSLNVLWYMEWDGVE